MDEYLIWSEEHGAWWAPYERGYTRSMKAAGRYSRERALAIAASANGGGTFCEVAIPFTDSMLALCELSGGRR